MKNNIIFLYVFLVFHNVPTIAVEDAGLYVEEAGIYKSVGEAESIFVARVISGSIKDHNANSGYPYEVEVRNTLKGCKSEKLTGQFFSHQNLQLGSEYLFFVRDCAKKNVFVVLKFDESAERLYKKKYLLVNLSFTHLIAVIEPDSIPVIRMGYPKKYIPDLIEPEIQGDYIYTDCLIEWEFLKSKITSALSEKNRK